jgi:hypothetical protein
VARFHKLLLSTLFEETEMLTRLALLTVLVACLAATVGAATYDYRVLAANKTSTMEKEMNEAAGAGYVFAGVMGGETSFGGKEEVVVMAKSSEDAAPEKRAYRLLATSRTSTMQKELKEAGDAGFRLLGMTVAKTALGGSELVLILRKG